MSTPSSLALTCRLFEPATPVEQHPDLGRRAPGRSATASTMSLSCLSSAPLDDHVLRRRRDHAEILPQGVRDRSEGVRGFERRLAHHRQGDLTDDIARRVDVGIPGRAPSPAIRPAQASRTTVFLRPGAQPATMSHGAQPGLSSGCHGSNRSRVHDAELVKYPFLGDLPSHPARKDLVPRSTG